MSTVPCPTVTAPACARRDAAFPPAAAPLKRVRHVTQTALATLAVVAFSACGAGDFQPRLGDRAVDPEVMQGLLRIQDIEEAGGDTSRLRVEVEDVLAVAEEINPEQSRGVESWHAMKVKRGRSTAVLIFTVVEFRSASDARLRLSQVESGLGFKPMDEPVGHGSAILPSSSGTGLAFIKDNRAVTIQTLSGEMAEPILDEEGVQRLARAVADRL